METISDKNIYCDGFLTDTLLYNLGIEESCNLHGDYHHLCREVWSEKENFGKDFDKVSNQLRAMFMSSTVEQWDRAYDEGKVLLKNKPKRLSPLGSIHDNPEYYAGYYTRGMNCNLG